MNEPPPHGVLDPDKHARLVTNRENIAKDARIPVELLWRALPALTDGEKDWMTKFRQHRSAGFCGLLLTGACDDLDPLSRFGAIAGRLSRNFIRARVFSLVDALAEIADGSAIAATCLLIPDFVADKKGAKEMASWKMQQLTGLLTERWSTSNVQTVLYAPSLDAIAKEYGSYVRDLIKNHYIRVEA
jgi:hypothetical protein